MSELRKIFSHKNTIKKELVLTPEIFINAFKYSFHRKKPYKITESESIQSDCLITETTRKYLFRKKDYVLYLCSDNTSDFAKKSAESIKAESAKKVYEISEDIKEHFKNIEYYTNLLGLLRKVFKIKISPQSIDEYNKQLKVLLQKELQIKIIEDLEKNSKLYILYHQD